MNVLVGGGESKWSAVEQTLGGIDVSSIRKWLVVSGLVVLQIMLGQGAMAQTDFNSAISSAWNRGDMATVRGLCNRVKWFGSPSMPMPPDLVLYCAKDVGDPSAMGALGSFYADKDSEHGFKRDWQQALYWSTESANRGYWYGMGILSQIYYFGLGVEKDLAKAYQWCESAAKAGAMFDHCKQVRSEAVAQGITLPPTASTPAASAVAPSVSVPANRDQSAPSLAFSKDTGANVSAAKRSTDVHQLFSQIDEDGRQALQAGLDCSDELRGFAKPSAASRDTFSTETEARFKAINAKCDGVWTAAFQKIFGDDQLRYLRCYCRIDIACSNGGPKWQTEWIERETRRGSLGKFGDILDYDRLVGGTLGDKRYVDSCASTRVRSLYPLFGKIQSRVWKGVSAFVEDLKQVRASVQEDDERKKRESDKAEEARQIKIASEERERRAISWRKTISPGMLTNKGKVLAVNGNQIRVRYQVCAATAVFGSARWISSACSDYEYREATFLREEIYPAK